MKSPPATDLMRPLSERQKAALITLLADEDRTIYQAIREKILSLGDEAHDWLQPHTLSNDPVIRRRTQEIVQHLAQQSADNQFLTFCLKQGEDFDIEQGAFLLARTKYPSINLLGYRALLDQYSAELRERIGIKSAGEPLLAYINQYLFSELRFVGNEENYYDPDNSYLNRVIDLRLGNPISLCLIYLFVGRRLKLPVTGIGMPGHFLLRFQTSKTEIYIDAFNKGKLLTKADCVKYLIHTSGFQESFLDPVSPRRILLRICSNLHQIYSQLEEGEEVARMQRYIIALAK